MAAVMGTPVASSNPNNQTNTSLAVTLGSTTVGDLNVIEISGDASGTGVVPVIATPSGWVKVGFKDDTNSGTGSSSSSVAIFYRFYQSGDGTSVAISWTNAGQMCAICTPWTGADTTTPIPYSFFAEQATTSATYTVADTTGATAGLLCTGFANRSASTAWSGLSDNARGSASVSTSGVTMVGRVTASAVAASTAYSKSATGASSSIGTAWAYTIKDAAIPTTLAENAGGVAWAGLNAATQFAAGGTVTLTENAGAVAWAARNVTTSGTATPVTLAENAGAVAWAGRKVTTRALTPAQEWVLTRAGGTQYVAHRDGMWAIYGEGTRAGYNAAQAWKQAVALEVPFWVTTDGVYVVSHDRQTGRVFNGTDVDITMVAWSAISSYTTKTGGYPIATVAQVVADHPSSIFVFDNKQDTALATRASYLDGLAPGRWIAKQYYAGWDWANAGAALGAPAWLYFYPTDLGSLSSTYSSWTGTTPLIFGLGDYSTGGSAPVQSDANTFFAFTAPRGIYTWAHILGSTAQKSTADSQAATTGAVFDGYMISSLPAVLSPDGFATTLGGVAWAGRNVTTAAGVTLVESLGGAAWAGQNLAAAAGVTLAELAGALAWAGGQASTVSSTGPWIGSGGAAWAGVPARTVAGVTLAEALGALAWAGGQAAIVSSAGTAMGPGGAAWAGPPARTVAGTALAELAGALAWAGVPARTLQPVSLAELAGVQAWAGLLATLAAGSPNRDVTLAAVVAAARWATAVTGTDRWSTTTGGP